MKRLIWDIPTRLFHWLLVLGLVAQYVTGEVLDDAMQWHFYIGYFVLGLVTFRILWAIVGTRYARFTQFVYSISATLNYIKQSKQNAAPVYAGHNPLGGWMVLLLLALVLTQAISGLFITDDVFHDGPYYSAVAKSTADLMSTIHHNGFNVLLGAIGLHIIAVIIYTKFKQQALVGAMFHGKKAVNDQAITSSYLLRAVIVAAIAAALVYLAVDVLPPAPVDDGFYY